MKKIAATILSAIALIYAQSAQAVLNRNPNSGLFISIGGSGGATPNNVVSYIITIILGISGLIGTLYLVLGGFYYVMSGTNEELAKTGKKYITNAIIGLIIIILSYTIISVVYRSIENPPT